jgi:hypothetical protein
MNATGKVTTRRLTLGIIGLVLAAGLVAATGNAAEIAIEIAPNTLNIQSDGQVVTVHTDIAYWYVDVASVYLNGVQISSWKADNRGNFVAKFLMDEVKTLDGLVIGDVNTLTIVGLTTDDIEFWGEQEIMVIDVGTGDSGSGDPGTDRRSQRRD